jgi:hypothetical protein
VSFIPLIFLIQKLHCSTTTCPFLSLLNPSLSLVLFFYSFILLYVPLITFFPSLSFCGYFAYIGLTLIHPKFNPLLSSLSTVLHFCVLLSLPPSTSYCLSFSIIHLLSFLVNHLRLYTPFLCFLLPHLASSPLFLFHSPFNHLCIPSFPSLTLILSLLSIFHFSMPLLVQFPTHSQCPSPFSLTFMVTRSASLVQSSNRWALWVPLALALVLTRVGFMVTRGSDGAPASTFMVWGSNRWALWMPLV